MCLWYSDGTSPWSRFRFRVPVYESMEPGPKPLDPGTRVQQNESSVEKITGLGGVLSGLVGNLCLDPGPRIRFVHDILEPDPLISIENHHII